MRMRAGMRKKQSSAHRFRSSHSLCFVTPADKISNSELEKLKILIALKKL